MLKGIETPIILGFDPLPRYVPRARQFLPQETTQWSDAFRHSLVAGFSSARSLRRRCRALSASSMRTRQVTRQLRRSDRTSNHTARQSAHASIRKTTAPSVSSLAACWRQHQLRRRFLSTSPAPFTPLRSARSHTPGELTVPPAYPAPLRFERNPARDI